MNRVTLFVALIVFMVAGCVREPTASGKMVDRPVAVGQPPTEPASPSVAADGSSASMVATAAARSLVGDQAVADLNRWYGDTRANCGSASAPAFLCTGVMLRATQTSAAFLPWNPNPSSTGVSFSWIRSDVNFGDLVYAYWNGFIFYPRNEAPTGANVINVRCVFPMDADTNSRPTLEGCGPSTQVPATSKPCGADIATAAQWLAHFNALADKYRGQCGWNMTSGSTSDRFVQSIGAHQGLADRWWNLQNEVRMSKWAQNSVVPIRAFFYVPGHANALQNAQNDQQRYAQAFAGAFAPIIRLTLPSSKAAKASFDYVSADQAVVDPGSGSGPGPEPGSVEDFESVPLTGPTTQLANVKTMVITSSSPGERSLSVENTAAPSMQGRHMVVRTIYSAVSNWYYGGFTIETLGKKRIKGIRLSVSHNDPREAYAGTLCWKPNGDVGASVNVVVPSQGQVTVECPGEQKAWYFVFSAVGQGLVFRFDNIELLN